MRTTLGEFIQAVVALFIVALLGTVFFNVLWTLNPIVSILFVVAILGIAVAIIIGIIRSMS